MAVIEWETILTPHDGVNVRLVKWPKTGQSFSDNDTGQPFNVAAFSDKTVQIAGTLGTGVTIEGSLDPAGSAYVTLNDPQGNALSAVTSAKVENILEHCYLLRPSMGTGVSSIAIYLLLSSTR